MGILTLKIESIILQVFLRSLILFIKYWRRAEELRGLIAQFQCVYQRETENPQKCVYYSDQESRHFRLKNLKDDLEQNIFLQMQKARHSLKGPGKTTKFIVPLFCQQNFKLENYFTYAIGRDIQIRSVLVDGQSPTLPFLFHVHLPKGKCSFISISIVNGEKGLQNFRLFFFSYLFNNLLIFLLCSYHFSVCQSCYGDCFLHEIFLIYFKTIFMSIHKSIQKYHSCITDVALSGSRSIEAQRGK